MQENTVWAKPKKVSAKSECYFYHTIDLPGEATIPGEWDLRGGVDEYFGGASFRGKRVLDVGTANGFLSFEIEKRGGEVISFDLDQSKSWDYVPYEGKDLGEWLGSRRELIERLNNGYWYCHRALKSSARVVYGDVYSIPKEIGPVDIAVVGSILLHLRDPWLALREILSITKERVIIVEKLSGRFRLLPLLDRLGMPTFSFLPDAKKGAPLDGWWALSPLALRRMLGVLGFGSSVVRHHAQPLHGKRTPLFTIVAERTDGSPKLH